MTTAIFLSQTMGLVMLCLMFIAMVFGMDLEPIEGKTYLHGDVNKV
jgi:hypothetical protein